MRGGGFIEPTDRSIIGLKVALPRWGAQIMLEKELCFLSTSVRFVSEISDLRAKLTAPPTLLLL